MVRHLAVAGWQIRPVADIATKPLGVDVVATKDGIRLGVEVKGLPSEKYADPSRSHEIKPTQLSE